MSHASSPSPESRAGRALSYLLALAVGVLGAAWLMPVPAILGTGALWVSPTGDLAQNLTGHLAIQAPGWSYPPLLAPSLFWPNGLSVAMTDSNPLVSLIAKVLAGLRGQSANLLGFWFAACWLLQPLGAVYALRGMGSRSPFSALAAAVIAAIFPALLYRIMHINLCGHFTLLIALGLALRMVPRADLPPRAWIAPCLLLIAAVLIHPYLFAFSAAVLAAPALQALLDRRPRARRTGLCFLVSAAAPVLLYRLLSGTLGGGDRGFAFYSMNLLSPVWPQMSGVFGPDLPILDPTGGEYEGFNYLGAGGLLLVLMALGALAAGGAAGGDWRARLGAFWRRWRGLLVMFVCLTLLALTTNVYAGHHPLLLLGARPWDQVFGSLQSAGRAFWVVGYAILLASIACLEARLPRLALVPALAVVLALQWIDTAPLRVTARNYFAGGEQAALAFPIPSGLRLLTTLPVCMQDGPVTRIVATERLAAARAGARLSDVKTSRLPVWFNCEKVMSDGTELPLRNGEMRIFLTPPAIDLFRQATVGADTICRRSHDMIVCTRGLPPAEGEAAPPGSPLPTVAVPAEGTTLAGEALDRVASWGWKRGSDGQLWSEGPRATLLFRLSASDRPMTLRLVVDGVGASAGKEREVILGVGRGPGLTVSLPDLKPATIDLPVPEASLKDGIVRIAFDIFHPIDPRKRELAAPVGRAGVVLRALTIQGTARAAAPSG